MMLKITANCGKNKILIEVKIKHFAGFRELAAKKQVVMRSKILSF